MDQPDLVLPDAFALPARPGPRVETPFRRVCTPIPAPGAQAVLETARRRFPRVNCYQAPVVWDRAEGFQVRDADGNCWIDFSSTAVLCNTGHAHPRVREAVVRHAQSGLLAQFSFASAIRARLAERLVRLAPPHMDKVYFWTTGSEATECAFRLIRQWGLRSSPEKRWVCCVEGDYHGCTLAAAQLSGAAAAKPWLPHPDPDIVHLPFPEPSADRPPDDALAWERWLDEQLAARSGGAERVAGIVLETLQGWRAMPLPPGFVQAARRLADRAGALLVFDEIQTGFCRTGRWFGHEHYGVRADLMCLGKGLTSSLPLAAVLGPAAVLDVLRPGEVTTTHAGHPLSCAAALANLDVLEQERLAERAEQVGRRVRAELERLKRRWPERIRAVTGWGLLLAIHLHEPNTGRPDLELARDLVFESVRRGVMLFHTGRHTVKICPPLVIPEQAAVDGVRAIEEAMETLCGEGRAE